MIAEPNFIIFFLGGGVVPVLELPNRIVFGIELVLVENTVLKCIITESLSLTFRNVLGLIKPYFRYFGAGITEPKLFWNSFGNPFCCV